ASRGDEKPALKEPVPPRPTSARAARCDLPSPTPPQASTDRPRPRHTARSHPLAAPPSRRLRAQQPARELHEPTTPTAAECHIRSPHPLSTAPAADHRTWLAA